jgi:nicotinamide-nucleotide amidase
LTNDHIDRVSSLKIASFAIGDELLDGRVADGNSKDLGTALSTLGLELCEVRTVPDQRERIEAALRGLSATADVVVTSGGLGPTSDDITAECIARVAGCGIRFDELAYQRMKAMFDSRGIPMPESNRRQAELPATSRTLDNQVGTAPGFVTPLLVDGRTVEVWSFPGVPREYRHLLEGSLIPALRQRVGGGRTLVRRTLRSLGLAESAIGERLAALERDNPDVRVQYRAAFPEVIIRLVTEAAADRAAVAAAEGRVDALQLRAKAAIGDSVWALDDTALEQAIVDALAARGQTLSLAESCTGGLVSKRVTDVSGSSAVFLGGVVSYANAVKVAQLDVPRALLDEHGAVSEPVALAMANGVRARLASTWAVATTGVAGPLGGSDDRPVGTVWFAVAGPHGATAKLKRLPNFGRERIREMAAAWALRLLLDALANSEPLRVP